ncbi:DUF2029 domain-containing protein [Pontibacter sp. 172403-2]|uniref:glycosyltransferase 87 family protein n=1 Tax=Pontibacter rufus TaxID=2791028 RepID=UPI0018AFBF6A|nr:glycosyltransferase 87 family protein [Pontibacter sp. 172403-2]MBF9254181.1 DUF2029 domain-containing protein [Pontibacter sp. 172403-2]
MNIPRSNTATYTLMALSAVAYLALGYATQRTEFTQLLLLFTFCFGAYLYLINHKLNLWYGMAAAILFRLLLLFAVPALSDDYFRFVWDGRLLAAGSNPYLYLPSQLLEPHIMQISGITQELYQHLNSQDYYSVYPPVAQAVGWLAIKLFPGNLVGNVVIIRLVLLLADAGNILLLRLLLRKMALPEKHVLLYALNPLVIIELIGNLHFEALMIFFLLLALLQLFYLRLLPAGLAFGLAVGVKLLPLLFLPLVLRRLGLQRFMIFGTIMLATVVAVFYPLVSTEVLRHILKSVNLYFQKFEFNASLYYVLRWLGFRLAGFNLIMVIGPLLSAVTLGAVLSMAAVKRLGSTRRLMGYMAAALAVYLFLATTVHPWYITTLLALTVVSHFRFAVVWSGLAILSYAAYQTPAYQENLLLVAIEYSIVFVWLLIELYLYRQRRHANLTD